LKRQFKCFILAFLILIISIFSFASEKYVTLKEVREDFLGYMNEYRREKNLAPLILKYADVAQNFANEQAERNKYLSHRGFNERAEIIKEACDVLNFSVYENCCWFTICADPSKKAFELFKNSSGHRKNMLGKNAYTSLGIAQSKTGAFYFCQLFF
jgi:uncharacterized protein YkwD